MKNIFKYRPEQKLSWTSPLIFLIIIMVTSYLPYPASGQTSDKVNSINLDSLHKILPGLKGRNQIDALNNIAFALARDESDSSILISKQSKALAGSINYIKGIADAHLSLGLAYLWLFDMKPSITHLLGALRLYEELEICGEMAITLRLLQSVNFMSGRFSKSNEYGYKALKVLQELNKAEQQAFVYNHIGLAFTQLADFDSAAYHYSKSLEILDSQPVPVLKTAVLLDQGYNLHLKYDKTQDIALIPQCTTWYRKALKLSKEINDSIIMSVALSNLASCYIHMGSREDMKTAEKYQYHQIQFLDIGSRPDLTIAACRHLAKIEKLSGHPDRSIELIHQGVADAKEKMDILNNEHYSDPAGMISTGYFYQVEIKRANWALYELYYDMANYEKALKHYELYKETKAQIYKNDNEKLIALLEAESENEKTENRIAGLERDRQMSELRASQSRYFNIGLGIFIIVLLLVSLLFIRQNKIKNEHRSTLLEQKLLRLQMNPHFIFNALSSIHSLMNPKDVGRASAYLGNFSSLLRSTLESSREDYILLEEEISAIRNYLELQSMRFHNKFKYTIDVDPGINLEAAIIPPMLIQPFIENAIEHGIRNKQDKGQVNVRFRLQQNMIICEIEDDGVGRKKAWETAYTQKRKHRSLATDIIHERIRILNRKFRLKIDLDIIDLNSGSGRPSGTLVKLDLPYILD